MPHPVLVIQHTPAEGPGRIGAVLRARNFELNVVAADRPLPADALEAHAGIVVMGGPMGVYDVAEHRRLRDEVQLLERALARGTPILGICLGSQLLAATLGAKVYRAPAVELGWHEVALEANTDPDGLFADAPRTFTALHWHGDVFDLPAGATHVARSAQTKHQAFSYGGSAWGLLFHLEAGPAEVRAMASAFPHEVAAASMSAAALIEAAERHAESVGRIGDAVFGRWADLVAVR